MNESGKRLPDWALWFACVLPFLGFWTYGLFDLDEGFYGAVVRDMIRRHDWITPTLNGHPWFEKPILAYWLAIPSVQLFGNDVGPRLPSVVCTLATVVVLFGFVRRHFSLPVARLTVLIYSTNFLVVGIGRMMMTDAPLVLCLVTAITTLADWRLGRSQSAGLWQWLVMGLGVGLGVLAKGPVALVLFGGVFLLSTVFVKDFKGAWKSAWPVGLVVCAGVLATWYWPCYQANGQDFVQKFLIEQNVGRFAGGDKAHAVPAWAHPIYFPLILALAFLPFVCFGGWTMCKSMKSELQEAPQRFVWIWALVPLVFFTISGTKLPHYILPAVAPLAILLSKALLNRRPRVAWEQWGLGWSAFVLVLAQYGSATYYANKMREVRDAANFLNYQLLPVYVYKMGGTGDKSISLTLRDTSHPSFFFYFQGTAEENDRPESWKANAESYFVLTQRRTADSDPVLQPYSVIKQGAGIREDRVQQSRIKFPGEKDFALIKHTSERIQ